LGGFDAEGSMLGEGDVCPAGVPGAVPKLWAEPQAVNPTMPTMIASSVLFISYLLDRLVDEDVEAPASRPITSP